ncbi:MAG: ACT domain-containing protein, partial [Myxococcota bacterium]
ARTPRSRANGPALRGMDLTFRQRTDEFAVCRLAPESELPEWLDRSGWYSLTRTDHELSIVCCADRVPESVKAERGWVMLEVQGPIPFETTGVLGRIASLLSAAEISLFVISTYDSDSVLVKRENLESTLRVFAAAGATLR